MGKTSATCTEIWVSWRKTCLDIVWALIVLENLPNSGASKVHISKELCTWWWKHDWPLPDVYTLTDFLCTWASDVRMLPTSVTSSPMPLAVILEHDVLSFHTNCALCRFTQQLLSVRHSEPAEHSHRHTAHPSVTAGNCLYVWAWSLWSLKTSIAICAEVDSYL